MVSIHRRFLRIYSHQFIIINLGNTHSVWDISKEKIWEYDNRKTAVAESFGFKVIHVWEKGYLKNKKLIYESLVKEIQNAKSN